ncbi:uncharacterized protein N0V89_011105 [Didymosphaeria variabile]|uniref:Ankyrin n=1 Tax=Didymosphaeria variabile TaxID=1932322 RepID=A0A9W9C7R5_9PLEO|nr:uncharacterized protein N0V89_011105 [Didymosphaeria variabile]KAJ4347167.1 hypothetical protein N0V89_011105 [Didymosphaeria variabile]
MNGRGHLALWNSPEWVLARQACELDDTTLLDQAILMSPAEDLDNLYGLVRRQATKNNATAILHNLIERGVSVVPQFPAGAVGASKETLKLLLAHGWDINARADTPNEAEPFMWLVSYDGELVKWCLDHGASVHPRGQEPLSDDVITKSQQMCETMLEKIATSGTVAMFELLRSKGAPLGWRPLHHAVEAATYGRDGQEGDDEKLGERMAMVRHLLDVVGLDVNAPDQPVGGKALPMRCGTPICYIPASGMLERDTRELTWLLLDRGADPAPALEIAKRDYPKFAEDVKAWKLQQGSSSKCCLQ